MKLFKISERRNATIQDHYEKPHPTKRNEEVF